MRPAEVARAVTAMVATPRGTQLAILEIQPEAPVEPPPTDDATADPPGGDR